MSAFEQRVEVQDRAWQYLVVRPFTFPPPRWNVLNCFGQIAAEPYQSIAFKIQAREIDSAEGMAWEHWDVDTKTLSFQFLFAHT